MSEVKLNPRVDYTSPAGTENEPIEQAMTAFVAWAIANDRNYHSDIVRENLQRDIDAGANPQAALAKLLSRCR